MPNGGDLDIETQVNTKDGEEWVTIIVKDNGYGINEKDLEKIFKPFFTTKESGKGTGLGLSISYRIIADHGGYIDVNSTLNVGTSFAVWLPVDNKLKME
jgi:signal transduction histidine kinase